MKREGGENKRKCVVLLLKERREVSKEIRGKGGGDREEIKMGTRKEVRRSRGRCG